MEQLGRQSMDLVLLNLNLPDMDGFAILHKILKQAPAIHMRAVFEIALTT